MDTPVTIGSASFTGKHLCEGHNSALSPCDTEINTFVETLRDFFQRSMDYDPGHRPRSILADPIQHRLDGTLIERWFCKTLINIVCVGKGGFEIPIEDLLPHLYKGVPFQESYGLSFAVGDGQVVASQDDRIQIVTLIDDRLTPKVLVGGLFTFRSLKFVVLLPGRGNSIRDGKLPLADKHPGWEGLQLNWHNKTIGDSKLDGWVMYQTIELAWK
jgi:hypothetical protein